MALDRRAKRLLDMLSVRKGPDSGALTIDLRRAGFASLMQMGALAPAQMPTTDVMADGRLRLRCYRATAEPLPAGLVFFHGGGLVAGSIETHDDMCRALAKSSGAMVISVGYRLAPESKFPAGLEDACFAVEWVAQHAGDIGIDASRLAVGGDSAGALLAALVCSGSSRVTAAIKAQILLCPVVDLMGSLPSRREFATGYLIDAATIAQDIHHCLPDNMAASQLPSPLRSDLTCLPPPTFIVSAECDPFRDEAAAYAHLLREAGVPVRHCCHAGMVHSFHGLPALLPQAEEALVTAGVAIAELLD